MKDRTTATDKTNTHAGENGTAFDERRRVIRGLASLPVALTLANGGAQAANSIYQCVQNTAGDAPTDPTVTTCSNTPPPTWAFHETPETAANACGVDADGDGLLDDDGYKWTYYRFTPEGEENYDTGYAVVVSCYNSIVP